MFFTGPRLSIDTQPTGGLSAPQISDVSAQAPRGRPTPADANKSTDIRKSSQHACFFPFVSILFHSNSLIISRLRNRRKHYLSGEVATAIQRRAGGAIRRNAQRGAETTLREGREYKRQTPFPRFRYNRVQFTDQSCIRAHIPVARHEVSRVREDHKMEAERERLLRA